MHCLFAATAAQLQLTITITHNQQMIDYYSNQKRPSKNRANKTNGDSFCYCCCYYFIIYLNFIKCLKTCIFFLVSTFSFLLHLFICLKALYACVPTWNWTVFFYTLTSNKCIKTSHSQSYKKYVFEFTHLDSSIFRKIHLHCTQNTLHNFQNIQPELKWEAHSSTWSK